jgi:hypothetical protein
MIGFCDKYPWDEYAFGCYFCTQIAQYEIRAYLFTYFHYLSCIDDGLFARE